MKPELKKDIDAICTSVAATFTIPDAFPRFLCHQAITKMKLEILGENAKDKAQKIDIKDTCNKLRGDIDGLSAIVSQLIPAVDGPLVLNAIVTEVDKLITPVILFHFMGIGEGRKPS